jgi:hypothetical protein
MVLLAQVTSSNNTCYSLVEAPEFLFSPSAVEGLCMHRRVTHESLIIFVRCARPQGHNERFPNSLSSLPRRQRIRQPVFAELAPPCLTTRDGIIRCFNNACTIVCFILSTPSSVAGTQSTFLSCVSISSDHPPDAMIDQRLRPPQPHISPISSMTEQRWKPSIFPSEHLGIFCVCVRHCCPYLDTYTRYLLYSPTCYVRV